MDYRQLVIREWDTLAEMMVELTRPVAVDGELYTPPQVRLPRWWWEGLTMGERAMKETMQVEVYDDRGGQWKISVWKSTVFDKVRVLDITEPNRYLHIAFYYGKLHGLSLTQLHRLYFALHRRAEWARKRRDAQTRHCQAVAGAQNRRREELDAEITLKELEGLYE